MPISVPDAVERRGEKDARRHRDKMREQINKELPRIIAEQSIITRKGKQIIKVPIKIIDIPHFRPKKGKDGGGLGIGQGSGQPGDVFDERPIQGGDSPGGVGSEPGVDYIETEVDLEELIEFMLEDLGLPRLEPRKIRELMIEFGLKLRGVTDEGPPPLLELELTGTEGLKRFFAYLEYLKQKTGRSDLDCGDALKQSRGVLNDALKLLNDPNFKSNSKEVEPFPILEQPDLRYRNYEKDEKPQSKVVVFAMMDVSGSMDTQKKYHARSMLFWLVEFLRRIYQKVEIRFIVHEATARLVDEDNFFKTATTGGTECWTAYSLANSLIDSEYPVSEWNVYLWHFSDGDDFSPERTIHEMSKSVAKGVNMIGFGQIQPREDGVYGGRKGLWDYIEKAFPIILGKEKDMHFMIGRNDFPLMAVQICDKTHIWQALKLFLRKDKVTNG